MKAAQRIGKQRQKRGWRVRNAIRKNSGRIRLSVFRSNKHIAVQLIDDAKGETLASASTREKGVLSGNVQGGNKAAAEQVGKAIAAKAKEKGITEVVFDRGHYRYHGRVAALADAAREAGLQF